MIYQATITVYLVSKDINEAEQIAEFAASAALDAEGVVDAHVVNLDETFTVGGET